MVVLKPSNVIMAISSTDRAVNIGYLLELTRYITQETSIAPRTTVWMSGKVTCLWSCPVHRTCVFQGSLIAHQLSQAAVGLARPLCVHTSQPIVSLLLARAGCPYIIL